MCSFVSNEKANQIEQGDVGEEERHHDQRIKDLVAVDQIIEDLVRRAVIPHEEHIVQIQLSVCITERAVDGISGDAKAHENTESDGHIFLF